MITALPMAKNSSARRTPARGPGAKTSAMAPDAARTGTHSTGCRFCRADLRAGDNFCSHCGMPTDPMHDQPLFVVESLSTLFNVVFYESLLEQELNRASRYGHHLSALVVEIDSLNELEAAYGYDEVNHLIRDVADLMAGVIRDPDTLAATNRIAALGTHRFLVLLPETPEEGAFRTAEKIRSLVASTIFSLAGTDNSVTLSVGVASTGPDHDEPNLLGRATQALIEGHGHGQNRSQVAPEGS
jgi:diguanylate cyclase (GGDEF)-like protein